MYFNNEYWVGIIVIDTVTDTADLYLSNVSFTHFQAILSMVFVSRFLKDTRDTAPRVYVSVSWIHFQSIFHNPAVFHVCLSNMRKILK